MIETWFNQDVKKAVKVQYLDGNVFSQDNNGNKIGVNLYDGSSTVNVSGSVSANVIRSDGITVACEGSSSHNQAWVVLPQSAYAVPGIISIIIKATDDEDVTTLCAVVSNVYQSTTDTVIDPGTIIPNIATLVAEIEAAVATIPADYSSLWTSVAPAFSSSTSYAVGDYCTYNEKVYRFTSAHSGSWNSSHATQVSIGSDIAKRYVSYKSWVHGGNLDNLLTPGIYYVYTTEGSGKPTNYPSNYIGNVLVLGTTETNSAGTAQYVVDLTSQLYIRYKTASGFTDWRKALDNGDILTDILPVVLPYTLSLKTTPTSAFDVNDLTSPGMYSIETPSNASHWPSENAGRLIVFGDPNITTNRIAQFAVDSKNNVYYRYISLEPLPWIKISKDYTGSLTSSNDLNDLTKYGQYSINNASSLPSNYPSLITGRLMVFGDETDSTNRIVQFVVDYRNTLYMRYKSAGWTKWTVINDGVYTETITVKASGGNYTTVPAAVKYVMDNWQKTPGVHYLIKIDPGTYDISSDVVSLISGGMESQGLWIPPNTTICGAGKDKTIIRFLYDGSDDSIMSNVSAFNAPYESKLSDVTITVKNIRYCIHSALKESSVSASYTDNVNIKLENVKLVHLGFDDGKNPTYWSPGAYGSGSTNGGRKEFYNCDFIAESYVPWFNHNRKGLTRATEFIFEGCSFINKTTEIGGSGKNSVGFITWADDPQNVVIFRHCNINKYMQFTIRTDSYGTADAHNGYYVSSDGDLIVLEPTTNNVHLDDNYSDAYCQKLIASESITAYTPVSKNSLTGARKYVSTDAEHGIALCSAAGDEIVTAKFGGHILLPMVTNSSFAVGKKIGWNGSAWVEDNVNPILEVMYSNIVRII